MATTVVGRSSRVSFGRIVLAGIATVAAAVVANLVVRAVLLLFPPIAPEFPPFQVASVVGFTLMGVVGATIAYGVITRLSSTPESTFGKVAIVVLILSIIPNILAAFNPNAMPFPGASSIAYLGLTVFHLVAALICIALLPRLARPE
jgi:hypothetical protein